MSKLQKILAIIYLITTVLIFVQSIKCFCPFEYNVCPSLFDNYCSIMIIPMIIFSIISILSLLILGVNKFFELGEK